MPERLITMRCTATSRLGSDDDPLRRCTLNAGHPGHAHYVFDDPARYPDNPAIRDGEGLIAWWLDERMPGLGPDDSHLLTLSEHVALEQLGGLWDALCTIVGHGPSRGADCAEIAGHIHALQRAVLAQAGARAYPDRYRLLGGMIAMPRA